ncbi:DUF5931 domain-containing protein [Streptomyces sp. NPDC005438]|uniref:MacS family sensor histidine kinase n=1 Tax=Streptomyces sp. NPDC005438 TaxID=3156880 RepID=UPI0033B468D8
MSVEQPLWRALTAYRVLSLGYALVLFALAFREYEHPLGAAGYLAVLTVWTLVTVDRVTSADRCTPRFLAGDMTLAVGGILLTRLVDTAERVAQGVNTLPSIWTAGAVLGVAVKGGWRWSAAASLTVGAAQLLERGEPSRGAIHNVLLVCVASIAIGYVVEVARASERTLSEALRLEATTRERERLARDIHDSVLQVLAMVQRRGTALGGEAAELGRMAGEQEKALRTLVSSGLVTSTPEGPPPEPTATEEGELDLRELLARYSSPGVTLVEPGTPVLLEAGAARELTAAVGAALDNVRRHATGPDGEPAQAWILLEDEPGAVLVTVRDDGPGIPEGRLADAEAEGRLGAAQSIRGRLRDLGGEAEWVSVPGQGTEVELRAPRSGSARG